jgi:hypothetical protein
VADGQPFLLNLLSGWLLLLSVEKVSHTKTRLPRLDDENKRSVVV